MGYASNATRTTVLFGRVTAASALGRNHIDSRSVDAFGDRSYVEQTDVMMAVGLAVQLGAGELPRLWPTLLEERGAIPPGSGLVLLVLLVLDFTR